MKSNAKFPVKGLCILLFMAMFLSILPLPTYAVVKEGDYSPQITLTGNCDLQLVFDVVEGEGWLEAYLYDTDAATAKDAIYNAHNCLRMRADDCYLIPSNVNVPKENRWYDEIDCTSWQYRDEPITVGTGYELRLNRWNNRIAVTVTGPDGTKHWDMVYDAKTDMSDTLYFCLMPHGMTLDNAVMLLGESESVWDTRRLSGEWALGISLACIVLLFVLNFVFSRIEKGFFSFTNFNFITGGLWGLLLITALGLGIPAMRELYCTLLGGIVGLESVPLVQSSVLLWVIVAVCAVASIYYWMYVLKKCCENPVTATLLMLVFGVMHAVAWYFIIGVAIRMILGGIVLAIVFLGLTGVVDSSHSSNKGEPATSLESTPPECLSRNGEAYYVISSGKDYLFIYPSKGDESDQFYVRKVSERCYIDNNHNEYFDWR